MVQFKRLAIISAALMAILATSPMAQERLRPVGSLQFVPDPFEMERGAFTIKEEDRRMRALRIVVREGSAELRSLFLTYDNGDVERVRIQETLRSGQATGIIRLSDRRRIRSVEITYVPQGLVKLDLEADAPRPPPPPQWEELGCRNVGFLVDQDAMNITSANRYKALRLRSTGLDVEMIEMSVRFANGGRETYSIRTIIPNNGRTSPIEMRGEARRLSQIEMLYRTRGLSSAKTRLCVDGLGAVPEFEE